MTYRYDPCALFLVITTSKMLISQRYLPSAKKCGKVVRSKALAKPWQTTIWEISYL